MRVERLAIADVLLLTPERHGDSRGYFSETFNSARFAEAVGRIDVPLEFVQDNESLSRDAGTLRGLHFQAPPFAQSKLVRVIDGAIFDVAVDIRRGSPTCGKWVGAHLSSDQGEQLWIPAGFLHGFITTQPNTKIAYKVTAVYDRSSDRAVRWDDPALAIEWPLPNGQQPFLSAKDATAPMLSEIENPF